MKKIILAVALLMSLSACGKREEIQPQNTVVKVSGQSAPLEQNIITYDMGRDTYCYVLVSNLQMSCVRN